MNRLGSDVKLTAIDYRNSVANHQELEGLLFVSLPATPTHIATSLLRIHRLFRNDKPDVIIASGDSHIGFLGLWLARDLGVPFVYDVYDYYPAFLGNRIPGMKMMFRASVKSSNLVLCASTPLMGALSLAERRKVTDRKRRGQADLQRIRSI